MLENEITVLRFSEVGGGRLLGTDPYARFWAKSGGWAFTRYWADTRYFTVVDFYINLYMRVCFHAHYSSDVVQTFEFCQTYYTHVL